MLGLNWSKGYDKKTLAWKFAQLLCVCAIIGIICAIFVDANKLIQGILYIFGDKPTIGNLCILILLSIILLILALPFWPLMMLLQGFIFGFLVSVITIITTLTIAGTLSYVIACEFKDNIREILHDKFPLGEDICKQLLNQGWLRLLFFRFAWIPLFIRNYAPAVFDVPFNHHVGTVFFHSIWLALIFASVGSGIRDSIHDSSKIDDFQGFAWKNFPTSKLWLLGISILCTFLITFLVGFGYLQEKFEKERNDEKTTLNADCENNYNTFNNNNHDKDHLTSFTVVPIPKAPVKEHGEHWRKKRKLQETLPNRFNWQNWIT